MNPTESQEQIQFVHYLRLKGLAHFRVPNETYTKSWKQKSMNQALGVSSGVPDLFVIVSGQLVAIEMKRVKGGVVSANQKLWIQRLNDSGIEAVICRGAKEAIEFIEGKLKKRS